MSGDLPPRIDENGWESRVFYQIWRKVGLVVQYVPVKTIGRRKSWTLSSSNTKLLKNVLEFEQKNHLLLDSHMYKLYFIPFCVSHEFMYCLFHNGLKQQQQPTTLHFILMCHLTIKNKWSVPGLAFPITIQI